jgi:ABC-type dipeptide/oligopeptide/nickel transport system permease subunit
VIALAVIAGVLLVITFAPLLAPYDPYQVSLAEVRQPPSSQHWLGTDVAGFDVLSRVIYGGRVSLSVAAVAVLISVTVGATLGLTSGYVGGWIDSLLQRLTEVFMSIPTLLLMITVAIALGPSIVNAMVIIGIFGWTTLSRLMRAQSLSLKEREFVLSARAIGCTQPRIILHYILRNSLGPLTVTVIYGLRDAILAEASLSFLGIGVPPPTPSWGNMVTIATQMTYLEALPWVWIPPAVMLIVVIIACSLVGDGLVRAFRH